MRGVLSIMNFVKGARYESESNIKTVDGHLPWPPAWYSVL